MMIEEEIVVKGEGIAGLATALALKRVGFQARVLERNPELQAGGTTLTLLTNAWFALRALGVDINLSTSRWLQTWTQGLFMSLIGFSGTKENRKALLETLAEELPPNTIRFSSKLISIDSETLKDSSKATLLHLENGTDIKAKVVIGCDGVHSGVAQWLGLSQPLSSGRSAARGLAFFPEGHGLNHGVKQYLSASTRAGFVTINSKEIYWFVVT